MGVTQQMVLICALSSPAGLFATRGAGPRDSFVSFVAAHGREYKKGTRQYDMRRSIYEHRFRQIQDHNSQTNRLWDAAVNHLSDRTEAELSQLRGLRVMQTTEKGGRAAGLVGAHLSGQFLDQLKSAVVPDEKSWAHLNAIKEDVDQSACGSCWAIAAMTMLRANSEINGNNRTFSAQELVSCVPNSHNCGGSGGCDGATVELAMNWVMDAGLTDLTETPYLGISGKCKKASPALISLEGHGSTLEDMVKIGFHGPRSQQSPGLALGLLGWERLPQNEYEPLIRAVAEKGPVAVSVGAHDWSSYGAGIFDACSADAVIDHAVTLIGYGKDVARNEKYWLIKNSWGLSWGENGNIRLLRKEGNVHCGTDYQPQVGTGCDGGPSKVPVCGMCGILYDSVVPHFAKAK